jgi:hypothetical protein
MVRARRGVGTKGCLSSLLLVAVVVYFGVNAFEVYWRYYQYRDHMQQQIRFASHYSNDQITKRLRSVADSLDLPPDAKDIYVARDGRQISVEAEYDDEIKFPFFVRKVHFNPRADGSY